MSGSGQDIIRWVIDCMRGHVSSITPELALTVEREARREWGGRSISYIARADQDSRDERAKHRRDALHLLLHTGQTAAEIAAGTGISRSSLYHLMARGRIRAGGGADEQ